MPARRRVELPDLDSASDLQPFFKQGCVVSHLADEFPYFLDVDAARSFLGFDFFEQLLALFRVYGSPVRIVFDKRPVVFEAKLLAQKQHLLEVVAGALRDSRPRRMQVVHVAKVLERYG